MYRTICAFVLGLLASASCLAQQSLASTYRMVSLTRVFDGKPEEPKGKPPQGYLIITPKYYSQLVTDGGRKYGASIAEKAALFDSLTAYSGSYRLDGNKIVVSVEVSSNEVFNGTQQTRDWQVQGNRLIVSSGPRPFSRDPSKQVVTRLEWEKVE